MRQSITAAEARLIQLRRELFQTKRQINSDWDIVNRCEYNGYRGYNNGVVSRERHVQMYPCPHEQCRGFVDGTSMVCGVCDTAVCSKCGMPSSEDHACDPDMISNFSAIKKQTRPCPKCAAPTFKIDGCMQMFCTQCQTPWDWSTGNIIRGVIHNPHYFEWLRERSEDGTIPRQPGDEPHQRNQCRNHPIPTGYALHQSIMSEMRSRFGTTRYEDHEGNHSYQIYRSKTSELMTFCRRILHVHLQVLNTLNQPVDNGDLRLKYLINHIDEHAMKVALQRRDKKHKKNSELHDIYAMACSVGGDLLYEYIERSKSLDEVHKDVVFLTGYVNRHLVELENRYSMTCELL